MKKIWVRLGATVTLTDEEDAKVNSNTLYSILLNALKEGRVSLDGETYTIDEFKEECECHFDGISIKHIPEKRMAYFIQLTVKNEKGEYSPCIAIENEPGYNLTDWTWGSNLDKAEAIADEKNEALGITKDEAMKIVLSTMRPRKTRR